MKGTLRSLLAQIRHFDQPVGGQLLFDAEAEAPVFGIGRGRSRMMPAAIAAQGWSSDRAPIRPARRSWPLGTGLVRFAWNVNPLSLVTGTGVCA